MATLHEHAARMRLLILEEDRHNIDELRDFFSAQGCECEVALDLETARRILSERVMEIAAVNVQTARISEEDLIRDFRSRVPSLSLVLYNGTGKKSLQRRLRRLGADSCLSKKSDLESVVRAIARVLESK